LVLRGTSSKDEYARLDRSGALRERGFCAAIVTRLIVH
jgi:hypothetical protein